MHLGQGSGMLIESCSFPLSEVFGIGKLEYCYPADSHWLLVLC